MKKLGKPSVLGISVLLLAILIHFAVYFWLGGGFMTGLTSAFFLIVLGIATTIAYTLATKSREKLMTGYVYVLTVLIISNFLRIFWMDYLRNLIF